MKPSTVAAALSLLFAALAHAQAPLDEVVVTATRFPEQRLDAPIGMTVITAKQIAESAARTLPQLLSQEAGIVTRDNTGSPDSQIDLRGFGITGDQNTLVLLNGQRLNDIELTTIGWSAIPLDSIERIEVLRGSGAVLYGSGATGGTINIITKTPPGGVKSATLGGSTGTYRTNEVRAAANLSGQSTGFNLFASDLSSDNYRSNNRLEQKNANGNLRFFGPSGDIGLLVDVDSQNLRLPGARTAAQLETDPRGTATPDDYSTREGARINLGGSYDLGFGRFAADLGYRDTTRTSFFGDYITGVFSTSTETHSRVWSFTPRVKIEYGGGGVQHSLVAGVDADYWDYLSRRAPNRDLFDTPPTPTNATAHINASQRDQAVYAQHNSVLNTGTKVTVGARWQRTTITAQDSLNPAAYANGSKTCSPVAWEVGLRQELTPATSIYGRAGQSFRLATVDEVYSQFGGPVGDAIVTLLDPQTSHDYELGAEYRSGAMRVRASAFAIHLTNEIFFFVPTFSNINLPPTYRKGVEVDASTAISSAVSLFANVSVTDARFREGTLSGVDLSGKFVPLVPRWKANAGVAWQLAPQARFSGVVRYVGSQYYDNDLDNTFGTRMPPYTVVDVKLTQTVDRLTLGIAINNLLNKFYYSYAVASRFAPTFNAYPQADTTFLATAEYRF